MRAILAPRVFGIGSDTEGTSFGVELYDRHEEQRPELTSTIQPFAPGTTVYLNLKNATRGQCGSGSCNLFATFK